MNREQSAEHAKEHGENTVDEEPWSSINATSQFY